MSGELQLSPAYQRKLDEILPDLLAGRWHLHGGKRMDYDREVIRVPLGRRFRVVLRDNPIRVEGVMTHETYNKARRR